MKFSLIVAISLMMSMPLFSQKTSVFFERTANFERGMDLYDKGLYGAAYKAFESSTDEDPVGLNPKVDLLSMKSKLMLGKAAVRMGKPDAEMTMLGYFRTNSPDALAYEAVMDLGDYYYNKRSYDEAIEFYKMVDPSTLTDDQRAQVKFKEGYALFIKKKFSEAKSAFSSIRNIQASTYYEPANYYYALSAYYTEDYNNAIQGFRKIEKTKKYKSIVPLHIAQILLSQKKYEELIAYAEPLMDDPEVRRQTELRQILGQAYFEMGQYDKALPYLEEVASGNSKLREDDIFQLGVAYYKQKEYTKAIEELKKLGDQNTEMGMYSMFYLADSYLKTDDKPSARNAFFKAGNKKFDPAINQEALFNYAKLSVELGQDRDAITTLQGIPSSSPYYAEAQELISVVLINTRDYEKAIKILDAIPNKSPQMVATYQKVNFYRGIQLHGQKAYQQAQPYFTKAQTGPDGQLRSLTHFWLGDIAYTDKNAKVSRSELNLFLAQADDYKNLPVESSEGTAHYILGYLALKEENYNESAKQFESAYADLKSTKPAQNEYIATKMVPDIVLRLGDSYLKKNNYTKAEDYYNTAINKKYDNFVYALYQNAVIEGLQGNQNAKINQLKKIADEYSSSDFADDALLELANTYYNLDRTDDGLAALNRLTSEHKNRSTLINKAYLKMGLLYYNKNDFNNALKSYKEVMKNNPNKDDSDAAMVAIKEIYVNDLKKPDDYFAYAETIPGFKATGDEKDMANYEVAENYYEEGNYESAIKAFSTYIQKYPKGARTMEAYFKRAESYTATKKYEPALKDYKYILGLGKNEYYKNALEKAAIISYNFNNAFEDSYQFYSELIDLETNENKKFEAQLGALRSAYRINKRNEVVKLADQVINNQRATSDQRATAHFYKAKSAQELKDYSTALSSYNEVIRHSDNVNTAESRYRIAEIYFLKNEIDMAENLAQEASQDNSEYPYWVAKSLILLSDVLVAKDDLFNAQAALEAVVENFNDDPEIADIANKKLESIKKKQKNNNIIREDQGDLEVGDEN